jgi:hypothetical protein
LHKCFRTIDPGNQLIKINAVEFFKRYHSIEFLVYTRPDDRSDGVFRLSPACRQAGSSCISLKLNGKQPSLQKGLITVLCNEVIHQADEPEERKTKNPVRPVIRAGINDKLATES